MSPTPSTSGGVPSVAVIVAHPDDESLWCGGFMLERPEWEWFVLTLCRGGDTERAARFNCALERLNATGAMADLDDGSAQEPLSEQLLTTTIAEYLPSRTYDLVLTHGPRGEYTRHRRHEECCLAVSAMWAAHRLHTNRVMLFAYHDDGGRQLPRVQADAHEQHVLQPEIFQRKYQLITEVYGFEASSWEARTTPTTEGFYNVNTPHSMNEHILAHPIRELDA